MLKQQALLIQRVNSTFDAACIVASFYIAYYLIQICDKQLASLSEYEWLILIIVPVCLFTFRYFGIYASMRTQSIYKEIALLFKAQVVTSIIVTSSIFLLEPKGVSRLLILVFFLVSFFLISLLRVLLRLMLRYLRRHGYNVRHVLIVGEGDLALNFIKVARLHANWGLVIAGVVEFNKQDALEFGGCPVLGHVDDLEVLCRTYLIDEVVFAVPIESLVWIDNYFYLLQEMGVTVRMVIDLYDVPMSQKELSLFHDQIPMLTFYSKSFNAGQLLLKRCLDIVGGLAGLGVIAVLLPFVAAAIRLESPGPVFFGQNRVGENGRIFRCWKFRSMYVDAEARKQELMAQNEMNGAMFKMKDDPRITRTGKFLRNTSIDELPQFWNVLRGEMSLVGTRPPTPDEVKTYENWHRKRICIKPGISGLWQVSGRSKITDFDEIVRLDISYIEQWSLWLDLKILLKTFWVVVAGHGSC